MNTALQPIAIPCDDARRARHGLPWEAGELQRLSFLWRETDLSLKAICETLARPYEGVLAKLYHAQLICRDASTGVWLYDPSQRRAFSMSPTPVLKGEPTMQTQATEQVPNIEVKTFIHGVDAASLSDDQIFTQIAKIESEIKVLEAVETKPQKLVARIDKLKEDAKSLADYVDARP